MSTPMRIGIIGSGNIAEYHIKAALDSGAAVPVAVCDPAIDRAKACAEQYGIDEVYASHDELLAKSDVEAVIVSVPNFLHHTVTIDALEAGKHVLCEKPMAIKAEYAEEMLATAERVGKLLQIGMISRHSHEAYWLKQAIEKGEFGRLYYARAKYIRRKGIPRFGGWFTTRELSGGGPLIDIGVHALDLAWYLLGTPRPVSVYGVTHAELGPREIGVSTRATPPGEGNFDVEDLAAALIRFENDATISLEVSWAAFMEPDRGMTFLGTEQGAQVLGRDITLVKEVDGKEVTDSVVAKREDGLPGGFSGQLISFVAAARGEAPCIAPADEGVVMTKMLLAIYESARIGKEVRV